MNCNYCGSLAGARYRVNSKGQAFCDDDCYDEYIEENEDAPNDFDHPYIDDYESIRSNYLDWLDNWETDLEKEQKNKGLFKVDEILDLIDEVYEDYWDYYQNEGDDGVFAREIYQYLLKFQQLQRDILIRGSKIIAENRSVKQDDWIFCDNCEHLFYPGLFSKEKLQTEINFFNKWKNLKTFSKEKRWPYYLRKIKRSCRFHLIDYPEWINLNYD